MNILVLGSGGREHALIWKLSQSKHEPTLFCAPGNGGTASLATNVQLNISDHSEVARFCRKQEINMVIVGPEDPLVSGIRDFFKSEAGLDNIVFIGPDAAAAQLEGSKEFAKKFMSKYSIPTAAYQSFNLGELEDGYQFLESLQAPYVLKADGLAAGKGVLILSDLQEAKEELKSMLSGKFGNASKQVVIEEFMDGIEFSVFALTDGSSYVILPAAKDYKRIGEGDTGLNTGGMGAVSPVPFLDSELMRKVEEQIVKPTVLGLEKEEMDYHGFVFFGLIVVKGEPKVIEYNVRLGDPETEVVLPRLKSDLVDLFLACHEGNLAGQEVEVDPRSACTVMLVSGGYPESYEKGKTISGLENHSDSIIFHAGTKVQDGSIITSGGRVLAVTSFGNNKDEALLKSYETIENIDFEHMNFRKDIGFDL